MKLLSKIAAALLCGLGLASLQAQETTTKWHVEIPDPISDGTRPAPTPAPEPIEVTVRKSRSTRVHVTQAPEIPGLPPITGAINVTVQLVEDPQLPDPPPPLPALPPDDPAVVARMAEFTERFLGTELVFLSATVYDHKRTFISVYPNGKHSGAVTAWSNLDFNHYCGFSSFRVKDALDGTIQDYGIVMGIGNIANPRLRELARRGGVGYEAPEIPEMPDLAVGGPSFIVVDGEADSPAMHTLEQIHDLYRNEGARMEAAYQAREKNQTERIAFLLANPPKPKDVTIQFWKRNTPSPRGVQAIEGGAQP